MVKRPKVVGYAVLAGVFLLGAVAGAGGSYAYVQKRYAALAAEERGAVGDFRLRALGRVLHLSSEQRDKIRVIMSEHREERDRLTREAMESCGAPLLEHKKRVESEIRAVLTPEQQEHFDKLLEKQRDRFLLDGPRPGRPKHRR